MNFPRLKLDLDFGRETIPASVFAKQYDNESRVIEITPLNCGQKLELDKDITAKLLVTKPDGHSVINDTKIESGVIVAELTDQILAVAGVAHAEIGLYKDSGRVSSQIFYIDIQKAAYSENKIESSNEFTSFTDSLEKANKALEAAEAAKEAADATAKSAQELIDDVNQKLSNGDFIGEQGPQGIQGKQGIQGEKGNDGVSPTVSVSKIDGGNRVTFTDTEGDKSVDILDGKPYELTDEDIQKVKGAALGEVTKAAENAQKIAEELAERAENGDFNGKDYVITASDKTEIAEQAAKLAGAMQGGTVTYRIPKEFYQTAFGDDPNSAHSLNVITITIGKAVLKLKQLTEDIEAGIVEPPSGMSDEVRKIFEKYISFDIKPWVPTPRMPWLDFYITGKAEKIFEHAGGGSYYTLLLNEFWNNDFKVSIHAENQNGQTAYACIKSDIIYSTDISNIFSIAGLIPLLEYTVENDEEMDIQTVNYALMAIGSPIGYGSALGEYTSYVTNDDVKEVTITFIPNNAVVEEYDDE